MSYPPQYPNGQPPYQPGPPPGPGLPQAPGGHPQTPPPFQGVPPKGVPPQGIPSQGGGFPGSPQGVPPQGGFPGAPQGGGFPGFSPQGGGVFAPPPPAPRKNKGPVAGCLGAIAVVLVIIVIKVVIGLAGNKAAEVIDSADDAQRTTDGEITDSGDLSPLKLQVGDCYHNAISSVDTTEEVQKIDAIPCTQRHNAQVISETTLTGAYPLTSQFLDKCSDQLKLWAQRYSAQSQALQQRDPDFSVSAFFPLSTEWSSTGPNRITCSVVSSTGDLGAKLPTL